VQVNVVPSLAFAVLPARSFLQNRPAVGAPFACGAAVGAGFAVGAGVTLALGEAGAGAGAVVLVAVELGAAKAAGT
jgi:hypothetical protein